MTSMHKFLCSKKLEWTKHVWQVEESLMIKVIVEKLNDKRPSPRWVTRWEDI